MRNVDLCIIIYKQDIQDGHNKSKGSFMFLIIHYQFQNDELTTLALFISILNGLDSPLENIFAIALGNFSC